MSTISPELQSKLANWRARCAGQGDPMTIEEYVEAISALRGGRVAALSGQEAARKKSGAGKPKALAPSAGEVDDLLGELEGLK